MSHHFYPLKVKDVRVEATDTVSIAVEFEDNLAKEFKYDAGQYLTFKALIQGEEIRRSYSICSAPHEGELRVAIKQVEKGLFSTFAINDIQVGDTLETMTPHGHFKVSPNQGEGKNYIFYAAGSGITPIMAMVKSILKQDSSSAVYLYYGTKTANETIFKTDLDVLNSIHSNFNLTYIYSKEDTGSEHTTGRIDAKKCNHFFDEEQSNIKIEGIYTCGPQAMIEIVRAYYTGKDLSHEVHYELFTVTTPQTEAPKPTSPDAIVQSKVTVIIDDEKVQLDLSTDGKNILQAAQDAGADVPFSCKGGVCCTCKAKVMEGSAKMDLNYALEDDEVEEGFILTCQAHPTSEICVVSYDEY